MSAFRTGSQGSPGRRSLLTGALRSHVVRQATAFAGGTLAANAVAIISTAIVTRHLSSSDFGNYAFAVSLLGFAALFFEFGFFVPASRLAAVREGLERRAVIGSALLLYIPVAAAYSATILLLSFRVDHWFHVDVESMLVVAAPFAVGFPFVFVLQQLAQGVDRLHVASAAAAAAQTLFVLLLALQLEVGDGFSSTAALVLRSIAFSVAGLTCAIWLRPVFSRTRDWIKQIVFETRAWGLQLYVGRVLSIGTYNMDVLMLGIWASSRSVGLYVLAGSVATVSGLPVTGMAAALFARMASAARIERRWLFAATLIGAGAVVVASFLAEPFIRVFFSSRYVDAAALVFPLAFAQFLRGITTVFNTFLSAHGRGRELRNAGIVLTGSNIVLNFALIPPYGAQGAAWASVLALAANFAAHVISYRRSYPL